MKYLIFRKKHDFKQDHKLNLLFDDLPSKDQMEILSRIKHQTGTNSKLFKKILENFSEVFVKARYFFAQEENGISNLFDNFVQIVCEHAVEVYKQELVEKLKADGIDE